MTKQQSQVASATPLYYRIEIPYQAVIGEDFDPANVQLSIVQTPAKFRPDSFDAQSTFNANDEADTFLFISASAGLECGKQACELVLHHTPFVRIKTLLEKNIEAKGFGWIDRELERLRNQKSKQVDSKHRSR